MTTRWQAHPARLDERLAVRETYRLERRVAGLRAQARYGLTVVALAVFVVASMVAILVVGAVAGAVLGIDMDVR